jgi:hypothetical protein
VGSLSEQATEDRNTQIRGKRIRKAGRRSGEVGRDVACRGLMKRANGDIGVEVGTGDATRRSTSRYRGRVGRGTRTNEVGRTEYTNDETRR